MIVGLGTDIVEISRFDTANINAIARRVLTKDEFVLFTTHKQAYRFLAKRWAAKEAAAKALGTGIAQGVTFQDFVISNNDLGAPKLSLTGKALEIAGQVSCHLSISDEKNYAVATVILERL
ncbi:holo-(acyl-carrier-protein) synthase [Catenovulum agarivorans DS-2]|uniref:Holo-[acyl-carrier-protein] synthase n=1 Tax=Catenovulum agarivorans DS-2 TaxID=1328313 RepID=W7QC52_9ALTE|nr:holo-(acyl-carrier-protein) synthase [Catenovulum agarivorans DS-2]